jgi:glycosyltransferase involved in cell wall biosynthesis
MKSTYISVIITAYDRKKFLLHAIKSAVHQTLSRMHYEIIVIKNYSDEKIDNFIDKYDIKHILMDGIMGEFLYAGLKASRGEIICFLDDDDLFAKEKLRAIYREFKYHSNLCYYHDDHIVVNEKYQKLIKKIGNSISFNLSSISVQKDIINADNLKKIEYNPDHFMYLSALEANKDIVNGKKKLTYYMYHSSASHLIENDINQIITYKKRNLELELKQFEMFSGMFSSQKSIDYIQEKIIDLEIDYYIFYGNKKPMNPIIIFKKSDRPFYARLEIFMLYSLVRLHGSFRSLVIRMLLKY